MRRSEDLHLADGDPVEPLQAFVLGEIHVDKFGVHTLDIGEHQQLLDAGIFTQVAFKFWVGVAPLPGGHAEECYVQHVRLVCIDNRRLYRGNGGGNDVSFDRVGVNPVVQLRERAIEVPREREPAVLVFLEALELLNQIQFKLRAEP